MLNFGASKPRVKGGQGPPPPIRTWMTANANAIANRSVLTDP